MSHLTRFRSIRLEMHLNRAAAKRAFDRFIAERQLNASQLEFVNLIIDHLTQCGWMRPEQLYASPFTEEYTEGPNGIFDQQETVQALVATLVAVQQNAAGFMECRQFLRD